MLYPCRFVAEMQTMAIGRSRCQSRTFDCTFETQSILPGTQSESLSPHRFMAKMQNNGKRPEPMPEAHLGLRPVAAPRGIVTASGAKWVPPPAPPPRRNSSYDSLS